MGVVVSKMIITNNEELLRVKCQDVLDSEVGQLIDTLERELDHANRLGRSGIGLAAPQIGIAKNIAIVRFDKVKLDLVNCQIKNYFDPMIFKEEGCLSFPGRVENTNRFQEVHIVNNLVAPHSFISTGMLAVVCQHELDHVNSILFMDRTVPKVTTVIKKNKVGPNDLCPCGCGKKYKKCPNH